MGSPAGTTIARSFDTPIRTLVSCCDRGYKAPDLVAAGIGVGVRALDVPDRRRVGAAAVFRRLGCPGLKRQHIYRPGAGVDSPRAHRRDDWEGGCRR
jgi:hypothetical protein